MHQIGTSEESCTSTYTPQNKESHKVLENMDYMNNVSTMKMWSRTEKKSHASFIWNSVSKLLTVVFHRNTWFIFWQTLLLMNSSTTDMCFSSFHEKLIVLCSGLTLCLCLLQRLQRGGTRWILHEEVRQVFSRGAVSVGYHQPLTFNGFCIK